MSGYSLELREVWGKLLMIFCLGQKFSIFHVRAVFKNVSVVCEEGEFGTRVEVIFML